MSKKWEIAVVHLHGRWFNMIHCREARASTTLASAVVALIQRRFDEFAPAARSVDSRRRGGTRKFDLFASRRGEFEADWKCSRLRARVDLRNEGTRGK